MARGRGGDFQQAMADGKAVALRERDRGGSAVTVYNSANALWAKRGDSTKWHRRLDVAAAHWQGLRAQALADLDYLARADDLEGFEL